MRAAVLYGAEDLRIERITVPAPEVGGFLLKVEAALTDGTDLKVFRRGYHAKMLQPPCVFGHEMAGVVALAGQNAPFTEGERVVVANSAPCGNCAFCARGQENLCEDLQFLNGAYAEYINVPARFAAKNTLPIPDAVPFESAAMTEPLACVAHGLDETPVKRGDRVGVIGLGPIGLFFIQVLKHRGCEVYAVGRQALRVQTAKTLGADHVLEISGETPVDQACSAWPRLDLVIEATGQPAIWQQAVALVRRGGTVNWFGGPPAGTTVTLETQRVHYDQITLKSPFHHRPACVKEALEWITTGVVQPKLFLSGSIGLNELPSTFKSMLSGNKAVKTVVYPGRV
jgi:L-iditol 2-dehydrogenase